MRMTHAQWMKDTAALGRVRSDELKAVDGALATYERALANSSGSVLNEKRALQRALEHWKAAQMAKGQDWRNSLRNKLKAVEKLDAELGMVIVGAGGLNSRGELVIDPAEMEARKIIANHVRNNTRTLFAGAQLSPRFTQVASDVQGAMSSFKSAAKSISSVGASAGPSLNQQVQSLLVSLFGSATASQVQGALGPTSAEFLTNVTPFVGAIKSGGQAIVKWGQAAKGLYAKSKMANAADSFAPGDPAAAFDAILRIQQREINQNVASAGIYTTSAAAKAAFTAADFGAISGPVLGAAETLALLVQKIYVFARDWNEMNDANTLLKAGTLDLTLFKTCPLLGCYLIANSNTSDVINLAVGDYGRPGWKFEVEAMVLKARPVFDKASEVIKGSRYEIKSMRGMKGSAVNRTKKTLGVPTGKLDGLVHDVSQKIDSVLS
jgi:hypothetical protein